jgi:anti-sigma-K factor RskA
VNIKEYISSGILEAYVLGDLSDQERRDVEKNLGLYPELKEELTLIEETQEQLLLGMAIKPRAAIKTKFLDAVTNAEAEIKIAPLQTETRNNFWRFAAAASISLALVSSYLAYNYWSKWKNTATDLSNLISQNQRVAQDYNRVNQRLDKIENDLKIIDNPAFSKVIMKGTPNAPGSVASVYYNASSQEVYLSIQSMKALSKENQYQLWAIIDGKPVDAGVFDSNVAGLMKMKAIGTGAVQFAVTVEPRGGKASPSLETMQVAGNVVKG